MFLPEHVADPAAGEDLQTAAALPHSEGDLCTQDTDSCKQLKSHSHSKVFLSRHFRNPDPDPKLPLTGTNLEQDPPAGGQMDKERGEEEIEQRRMARWRVEQA